MLVDSTLTPIPQTIEIKPAFEERYRKLLGGRYDEYLRFSSAYIRKAIRVNTLKTSVPQLRKRLERQWKLTPVPWCSDICSAAAHPPHSTD